MNEDLQQAAQTQQAEQTQQTGQILKVDVAGRVWPPRARREAVLDEFERSGLPGTKFAERIGVKYPAFAAWVQQRRRGGCGQECPRYFCLLKCR